jgi:glycerophosphoryl diester phosphodiesterase family protein
VSAPAPLRLRPLEIGDVLDETFRMYRRHFFLFAGISVILAIPTAALSGYSFFAVFGGFLQALNNGQNPDTNSVMSSLVLLGAGYLLNFLLSPFTFGAVIYAACESALGRPVTIWGALRGVLRRYFAILGYVLLLDLMILLFCLFPLWIWIAVGWVAVLPVIFIEKSGLVAAMGRSWRLVEGRWWRTFLILFLILLLSSFVSQALAAFLIIADQLAGIVASNYLVFAVSQAIAVIVAALVNPVVQIAVVLIYFDLRVRREAIDLFQLAQRVSTQPA